MKLIKFRHIVIILILFSTHFGATAQVKIGENPGTIDPASLLELESTTKGVLLPRMTETQRDAIGSPPTGLWVFNTTVNMPQYYDGTGWTTVADQKAYGSISLTDNATATTFTGVNTYIAISGTYVFSPSFNEFEMTTNGQLKYIGSKEKHFHIVCNVSMSASGSNQVYGSKIGLNGVESGIEIERKISSGGDIGAFSVHADFMLSNGDELSFMTQNKTSTASATVKHLYLFAMSMN